MRTLLAIAVAVLPFALLASGCPEPYVPESNTTPSVPPGVSIIHFTSSPSGAPLYLGETADGSFAPIDLGKGHQRTPNDLTLDWNKLTGTDTVWFRVKFSDGTWSASRSVARGTKTTSVHFARPTTPPPSTNTPSAGTATGALDDAWTSEDP